MKITINTDDYVKELRKQIKEKLNADEIEISPAVNKMMDSIIDAANSQAEEMKPEVFAKHIIAHAVNGTLEDFWDIGSTFFKVASQSDKSDQS